VGEWRAVEKAPAALQHRGGELHVEGRKVIQHLLEINEGIIGGKDLELGQLANEADVLDF